MALCSRTFRDFSPRYEHAWSARNTYRMAPDRSSRQPQHRGSSSSARHRDGRCTSPVSRGTTRVGDVSRDWLGLNDEQFYDSRSVALIPMGFCFPGSGSSGDLPPRPECAPLWHDRLLDHLPSDRLDIIIGAHAQRRYIADRDKTLTLTVARWRDYLPGRIVLPHPSPRNQRWLKTNPWFEEETIPAIRARVAEVLS